MEFHLILILQLLPWFLSFTSPKHQEKHFFWVVWKYACFKHHYSRRPSSILTDISLLMTFLEAINPQTCVDFELMVCSSQCETMFQQLHWVSCSTYDSFINLLMVRHLLYPHLYHHRLSPNFCTLLSSHRNSTAGNLWVQPCGTCTQSTCYRIFNVSVPTWSCCRHWSG